MDRRRGQTPGFQLGQPFFMQIPKAAGASALSSCTLLALFADHLTAPAIWYGPVYLLICAFAAWFMGNRFAVLLGLFIASIQILNGHAAIFPDGEIVTAINFALRICSALAVVLMLGVAREALEIEWNFARIDPLTGALNRKAFFEAVERETGKTGMAILVFADVDGLKRLNDKLGHVNGDDALRDFASRIRASIRKEDLFARIGGDEFVILMKVRNRAAAKVVAKRLNRALNLELQEGETKLKCSLGVLFLPEGSESIDVELNQADRLMYLAKRERTGLVMAMSVKGDMKKLTSFAPESNSSGTQLAAVRRKERKPHIEAGARSRDNSLAA